MKMFFLIDWGTYDPKRCIIYDNNSGSKGNLRLSSALPNPNLSNSLNFFYENNPGHTNGDCFCVLCPITFKNFLVGIKKVLTRMLKKSSFKLL